jgi:hypothetical protein
MQPAALSLEPVIFLAIVFFSFGILPLVAWGVWKQGPKMRVLIINLALITVAIVSFLLGKATGRSMAWYHWRSEYKEPLFDLQIELSDALKSRDTNAVIKIVPGFEKEEVNSYGHERLFEQGKFRGFVERVKDGKLP